MRIASITCIFIALAAMLLTALPAPAQRIQFGTPAGPPVTPSPPMVGPGPTATFDGTIHPPPAQWDPYATPGGTPAPLLPQDPYFQYGAPGAPPPPGGTWTRIQRLINNLRVDYVWMVGAGPEELGINDVETSVTLAIPFLYNTETPLLVTPGFAIHFWNGPESAPKWMIAGDPTPPDLPPQTFDAWLEGAWNPQATPWFGGELSVRIGVYSDFNRIVAESIRYQGKGMAVLQFSPSFQVKAGIWYLDRNKIKLLPAGGIVWTPNPDLYFNILFPNPKIARRLRNQGNCEWWLYARGEYGGGAWTITRVNSDPDVHDRLDSFDYNDIRVAVGLEWVSQAMVSGLFEAGFAFEREIIYHDYPPDEFIPNNTVFLHGGLSY